MLIMFLESKDVDGLKPEVMDITNDSDHNVMYYLFNKLFVK